MRSALARLAGLLLGSGVAMVAGVETGFAHQGHTQGLTPLQRLADGDARRDAEAFEGPVARAYCGPGSSPETALQGQVPRHDRDSGRSAHGYSCNLERIGHLQGEGSSWVSPSYGHCVYMSTRFPSTASSPGVQVIDVSDPRNPRRTATLTTPAMLGTWETLKVSESRGLLAAVSAPAPVGNGAAFFDVYDVKGDCAHPRLLASVSATELSLDSRALGHEGGFSPDGMTYWSTLPYAGRISALDLSDPTAPRAVFTGTTGGPNHGFGFSPDGARLYVAQAGRLGSGALWMPLPDDLAVPNGLQVFDASDVQARRPNPQLIELGRLFWTDGAAGQHAIHVTYGGRPHLVFVDELLSGAARIIDIGAEHRPRIVSKLKLEIQMPGREDARRADTEAQLLFGYDAHYCEVDRQVDPTTLACAYFASGIRVFDIRNPQRPRELAYFNPPAQAGKESMLPSSEHAANPGDMTTDWCSSPPRFVDDQLWVTCQDNGFMVLRFTNGVYPAPAGTPAELALPSRRVCVKDRRLTLRLRRGVRSARIFVNGKLVRRFPRRRIPARVTLRRLPRGTIRVRVVARTKRGRKLYEERLYRPCRQRRA